MSQGFEYVCVLLLCAVSARLFQILVKDGNLSARRVVGSLGMSAMMALLMYSELIGRVETLTHWVAVKIGIVSGIGSSLIYVFIDKKIRSLLKMVDKGGK